MHTVSSHLCESFSSSWRRHGGGEMLGRWCVGAPVQTCFLRCSSCRLPLSIIRSVTSCASRGSTSRLAKLRSCLCCIKNERYNGDTSKRLSSLVSLGRLSGKHHKALGPLGSFLSCNSNHSKRTARPRKIPHPCAYQDGQESQILARKRCFA